MAKRGLSDTKNSKFSVSKIAMSKKAISDIVVTVLIILLALGAIVIIWFFVRPFIFSSSSSVDIGQFSTSFSIVKDRVIVDDNPDDGDGLDVKFSVRRGAGDAEVVGMNWIIEDSNGDSCVTEEIFSGGNFEPLETRTSPNIPYGSGGCQDVDDVAKVSAAPIFLNQAGERVNANVADSFVVGEIVQTPPSGDVCGDGQITGTEVCDGNSQTCTITTGGYSGTQQCNSQCNGWLTCTSSQSCGDSIKNGNEVCDGSDLGSETCSTQGFTGGTLNCNANCQSFVTSSCTSSGPVLPSDLISYWKFDGNFLDNEVASNDGTATGGASIVSDTERGSVVNFDGINDYVAVADDATIDFDGAAGSLGQFSVAAWIKFTPSRPNIIIGKGGLSGSDGAYQFFVKGTDNKMRFILEGTGTSGRCTVENDNTALVSADGAWHHVVAVVRTGQPSCANSVDLYLDGQLTGKQEVSPSVPRDSLDVNNNFDLLIGARDPLASTDFASGRMDDVMIFNRALTFADIQQVYSGTS